MVFAGIPRWRKDSEGTSILLVNPEMQNTMMEKSAEQRGSTSVSPFTFCLLDSYEMDVMLEPWSAVICLTYDSYR